jgi:uncharacterized protein
MVIKPDDVRAFLSGQRIVVVGASDDASSFGRTILRTFRSKGYDTIPVNRCADTVDGLRCYHDVREVPGPVDGVVIVVTPGDAAEVVRACGARDVRRVWLFKGLGGAGAVSDEALALCEELGITVVPGACPMMFLEPVGWFHRLHRAARHANGSLARAS